MHPCSGLSMYVPCGANAIYGISDKDNPPVE